MPRNSIGLAENLQESIGEAVPLPRLSAKKDYLFWHGFPKKKVHILKFETSTRPATPV